MSKVGLIWYLGGTAYHFVNLKRNLNPQNYTIIIPPLLSY